MDPVTLLEYVSSERDESGATSRWPSGRWTQRAWFSVDNTAGSKIAAELGHSAGVKVTAVVRG